MLINSRDEQADAQGEHTGMSDEQIRDEVLTIFLAGYETVANGLAWTWYLLSQNPEVEAKLQAELDTVLGHSSNLSSRPEAASFAAAGEGPASSPPHTRTHRLPTLADYPTLRYTEQVFAEAMRLYPPAWAMGRMSTKPVTLGTYRIPPGAHFFFSQYIMGRDPQYFPDPLRFDPDRFTPENKAARPKFTYFPFGGGSRQCIGESFAWMEGVLAIATIAQRWRMTYLGATPPIPQAKITLRPRDPLLMRLTPR
jgi:cytochrome P450